MFRKTIITLIALLSSVAAFATDTTAKPARYIVQADSVVIAKRAVIAVKGEITHELDIINAVGAMLSAEQYGRLAKDSRLKIQLDRAAGVAAARLLSSVNLSRAVKVGDGPSTFMSTVVGASNLHRKGIIGTGVTVAVVDTGYYEIDDISKAPDGSRRILAQYDAISGQMLSTRIGGTTAPDMNGHGSHVTSIIVDSERDQDGNYLGVARREPRCRQGVRQRRQWFLPRRHSRPGLDPEESQQVRDSCCEHVLQR